MPEDPDIAAFLTAKKTGSGSAPADPDIAKFLAAKQQQPVSQTESFVRGAGQGASLGFGDELAGLSSAGNSKVDDALNGLEGSGAVGQAIGGGLRAALPLATGVVNPQVGRDVKALNPQMADQSFQENYASIRDQERQANQAAEAANPKTYLGGQIAGGLATAAAAPGIGAEAFGTDLGARLGVHAFNGALQGGAAGLGFSNSFEFPGVLEDIKNGALMGGGAGLGAGLVGEGLKAGVRALPGMAERRELASTGMSAGDFKRVADNPGGWQQAGRDMLNAKLPIAPQARADALNSLYESTGQKMGQLLDLGDARAGGPTIDADQIANQVQKEVVDKLGGLGQNGPKTELENLLQEFKNMTGVSAPPVSEVGEVIPKNDALMTMSQAHAFEKQLGKLAYNYVGDPKFSANADAIRSFRRVISDALDSEMSRVMPDGAASAGGTGASGLSWKEVNRLYGSLADLDRGVASAAGRQMARNVLSPSDKAAAMATALATHNPIAAGAAAGANHAVNTYGNQIAAKGLDRLGQALQAAPEKLGRFAAPLQNAAARGPSALAAAQFVLSTQDPEFRQMLKNLEQ